MSESNQDCTLLQQTRKLLNTSEETYSQIFLKTRLEINWLSGVATGRVKNPSVKKIQKLYEYLTQRNLPV